MRPENRIFRWWTASESVWHAFSGGLEESQAAGQARIGVLLKRKPGEAKMRQAGKPGIWQWTRVGRNRKCFPSVVVMVAGITAGRLTGRYPCSGKPSGSME